MLFDRLNSKQWLLSLLLLKTVTYGKRHTAAKKSASSSVAAQMRDQLDRAGAEERMKWIDHEGTKMSARQCLSEKKLITIVKVMTGATTVRRAQVQCPGSGFKCQISNDFTQIDSACNTALLLHKFSGREIDYSHTRRSRSRMLTNTRLPLELWEVLLQKFPDTTMPIYALPLIYLERESADARSEMFDPQFVNQFVAINSYQRNDRYYLPYMHGGLTFSNLILKNETNYIQASERVLRRPKAAIAELEAAILKVDPNGSKILEDIGQMPQAPIAWITSSHSGKSHRHAYVRELLNHIPIDSWGRAVNTRKDVPDWWQSGNAQKFGSIQYDIKRVLMSRYKFYLVFENSICPEYVTEKIWQALQVGTVPIYLGTKDVIDFVPHPDALIQTRDFKSPTHLASYLKYLLTKPKTYEKHRSAWRKRNFQKSFYTV